MTSRLLQGSDLATHLTIGEAIVASRAKQIFVLPDEFFELLTDLAKSMNLLVVLQQGPSLREAWNGNRDALTGISRVFLADPHTVDDESLADESAPARLGWVMAEVPIVEGDKLFGIQVGARGDWFDKPAGVVHQNKEALKRFDRIWKKLARQFKFPMRARNVVTGAESTYASVGYSVGVAGWLRSGRRLRQRGVENIEFLTSDATSA